MDIDSSSGSMEKTRLRVGTWNVHGWKDGHHRDTFDDICSLLCTSNLDIIGLQEASKVGISELLSKLGSSYRLAHAFGGTALIVRLPVARDGGITLPKGRHGRFSACSVHLPNETEYIFHVINVHLNHKKEQKRRKEVTSIVSLMTNEYELPDLWVGDFNALTKDDYTEEEWERIFQVRKKNNWELPVCELTSIVTGKVSAESNPAVGTLGLKDAYASLSNESKSGPFSTCRFNTRIDYVYFNAERMSATGWKLVECNHVECTDLSDHNLVIATFEK